MCLESLREHSRGDNKVSQNKIAMLQTSTRAIVTKTPHKPTDSDIEESIEEVYMVELNHFGD